MMIIVSMAKMNMLLMARAATKNSSAVEMVEVIEDVVAALMLD